jgi:hypothetical protein
MLPIYANDKEYKVTKAFRIKDKIYGWLRFVLISIHLLINSTFSICFAVEYVINLCFDYRLILSDKTSRNLFLFLLLNLSFAFVELTYGIWTNR